MMGPSQSIMTCAHGPGETSLSKSELRSSGGRDRERVRIQVPHLEDHLSKSSDICGLSQNTARIIR